MNSLRIGLAFFVAAAAFAQTTTVIGTITDPAGDPVSGSCTIQSAAQFTSIGGSQVPTAPMKVPFTGGSFSVALVPTDTASPGGQYYNVTCSVPLQAVNGHSVGPFAWGPQHWTVPTSSSPVNISAVRLTTPPSSAPWVVPPGAEAEQDGWTLRWSSAAQQWVFAINVVQETPAGTIDGTNPTFTLAYTPVASGGVVLIRNGLIQSAGGDYSLSGRTLTFTGAAVPQLGDILLISYQHL